MLKQNSVTVYKGSILSSQQRRPSPVRRNKEVLSPNYFISSSASLIFLSPEMSIHHDLLKLISLYLQTLIDQHLHIWKKEEFL